MPCLESTFRRRRIGRMPGRLARNAMVGLCRMWYIIGPKPRHVTTHAFGSRLVAARFEQGAVARQAHRADRLGLSCTRTVRIMASAAPETAAALTRALTLGQQLALTYRAET